MPSVQKSVPDEDEIDTVLAPDIEFSGSMETSKDLLVKGRISGSIVCGEDLYISEDAVVSAEIKARRVIVRGSLEGRVVAVESIQVLPGSRVGASLEAPEVVVEEKELFRGTILAAEKPENV
ncbi:MAG: polymer-forming cytoskeletal protein [Spirochaetes bacterium]|nr:polymer-forming cytoskeletal protein [Spirochaetota bacterium]